MQPFCELVADFVRQSRDLVRLAGAGVSAIAGSPAWVDNQARVRLKPDLPPEALAGAYRKLTGASIVGAQGITLVASTPKCEAPE